MADGSSAALCYAALHGLKLSNGSVVGGCDTACAWMYTYVCTVRVIVLHLCTSAPCITCCLYYCCLVCVGGACRAAFGSVLLTHPAEANICLTPRHMQHPLTVLSEGILRSPPVMFHCDVSMCMGTTNATVLLCVSHVSALHTCIWMRIAMNTPVTCCD